MARWFSLFLATYHFFRCSYLVWQAGRLQDDPIVYTTAKNVQVSVYPGKKTQSPYDFIVKFRAPNLRERTPKHVHLMVELYVKQVRNPELTMRLRDHIVHMMESLRPATSFPPVLQYFRREHVAPFVELDQVGEFTVEFIMVVAELVAIQETTNYPGGTGHIGLYQSFGKKDRFSVIQAATWTNRK